MAKLKPWYQVVTPREDLRENRPLDASEFAVHLDHIRDNRAHEDYVKPERFFERTYMTRSLLDLSAQVVRRLSGIKVETSAVFNMATQFGGGKSHSLTALYHLARGGDDGQDLAGRGRDPHASPGEHRPQGQRRGLRRHGVRRHRRPRRRRRAAPEDPWGEIAWQLGGEKSFAAVAKHDEQGIAPAGDVIRKMLPKEPSLILMDELLNYVSKARKTGLAIAALQLPPEPLRGSQGPGPRRPLRLHPGLRAGDEPRGPARLRLVQEAPRPRRQGDQHVVRRRGHGDHPPPALRLARILRRHAADRRRPTPNGRGTTPRRSATSAATRPSTCSWRATRSTRASSRSSSGNGRACPGSSGPGAFSACSPSGFRGPTARSTRRRRASRSSRSAPPRSTTRRSATPSSSSSAPTSSRSP